LRGGFRPAFLIGTISDAEDVLEVDEEESESSNSSKDESEKVSLELVLELSSSETGLAVRFTARFS
jgi:hypothetical protein